jgi:hypothetical protein
MTSRTTLTGRDLPRRRHPPGDPTAAAERPFLARLRDKGRLSHLGATMSVSVVLGSAAFVRAATAGLRPPTTTRSQAASSH